MALMAPPIANSNLHSSFSPYTDSPSSPNPLTQPSGYGIMQRLSDSADQDSLAPPSPYPATVDPSPVDSNHSTSTDATDIEVEEDRQQEHPSNPENLLSPASNEEILSPASGQDPPGKLNTQLPARLMGNAEDGPASVIHIPSGFKAFARRSPPPSAASASFRARSGSSPSQTSEVTISPKTPEKEYVIDRRSAQHTSPINTSIPPDSVPAFGQTPRASTRQEADEEFKRKARLSKSLEDIAEADDADKPDDDEGFEDEELDDDDDDEHSTSISSALESLNNAQEEISALKNALGECWTLCNTLAGLSSNHRERMFSFANSGDMQEQAWRSCWRLCQNLYENRDAGDVSKHVSQTLELCRDFCMALFDARQRTDESLDSILRVSFELNNHLYNTHDRNLAPAFKERTLDFYVTMCHRLMKQRTSLPEETDSLLRSCWALAENLFSLRQNTRDSKPADEELLSSAVQACWDLCDLFREGWTQIRPDRGTPRPAPNRRFGAERDFNDSRAPSAAGSSVSYAAQQTLPPSRPTSSMSLRNQTLSAQIRQFPPETPTTLFDETTDSPAVEPSIPNIMILGASDRHSPPQPRHWSSSASQSSQRSSSTASTTTASASGATPRANKNYPDPNEEPYLPRLKALIVKAAMNNGYNRASPQSLQSFVKTMNTSAFGPNSWQKDTLEQYRRLVLTDPSFKPSAGLPSGKNTAPELARAVQWLAKREDFLWLRDLFRIVIGFSPEDAPGSKRYVVT